MIDGNIEASFKAWMDVIEECDGSVDELGVTISLPILQESHIIEICNRAIAILKDQPMVVRLNGPIHVAGDIHGSLHDMIRIFFNTSFPSQSNFLFLGDYVDRGEFSIEVITLLLIYFIFNPENITLLRGNHETMSVNSTYGFKTEIRNVYGSSVLFEKFNEVFNYLPLSAIINSEIACFHGGISPDLHDMDQILSLEKPLLDTTSVLVKNILWSDPKNSLTYFNDSLRADAVEFGALAQLDFFKETGMKLIIRAHECVELGLKKIGKCLTVFSSSDYHNGNQAAILTVEANSDVKVLCFMPFKRKYYRDEAAFYYLKTIHYDEMKHNSSYPLTLKYVSSIICITAFPSSYSLKPQPMKMFSGRHNVSEPTKIRKSSFASGSNPFFTRT